MHKLLLLLLILIVSNQAVSAESNQKLLCQGWQYVRDSNGTLINPNTSHELGGYYQLIDVDLHNMKISAKTNYGDIKANLKITDEYFSGSYPYNAKIGNFEINSIQISVNRYTGEGYIGTSSLTSIAFTIFMGECKSQQKKF